MPAKTIKMTKRALIKEHKRLTKLLSTTMNLMEQLAILDMTTQQKRKLYKIYEQIKKEYEDQIQELEEYKQQ